MDGKKSIYIADDEKNIRDLMRKTLEKAGYQVKAFENGEQLFAEFQINKADLVILDVMMDGIDGISICCMLRQISTVPIIIVSAKDSEMDKVTGINIGCDDYLTKPFSLLELTVRVKAIFRRLSYQEEVGKKAVPLEMGNLSIDENLRTITCNKLPMAVTPTEFQLLTHLMKNRHRAVSREELLRNIWDCSESGITTRATDDALKRLRSKPTMSEATVRVQTVRGFGFIIEETASEKEKNDTP